MRQRVPALCEVIWHTVDLKGISRWMFTKCSVLKDPLWREPHVILQAPKTTYSPYCTFNSSKPLSSVYKKQAGSEFGKVPEQVSAHVESFRRWPDSMPHLKCTNGKSTLLNLEVLDETILLSSLRHTKHNHMKKTSAPSALLPILTMTSSLISS